MDWRQIVVALAGIACTPLSAQGQTPLAAPASEVASEPGRLHPWLRPGPMEARLVYGAFKQEAESGASLKDDVAKGFAVGVIAGVVLTLFAAHTPQSGADILISAITTGAVGAAIAAVISLAL